MLNWPWLEREKRNFALFLIWHNASSSLCSSLFFWARLSSLSKETEGRKERTTQADGPSTLNPQCQCVPVYPSDGERTFDVVTLIESLNATCCYKEITWCDRETLQGVSMCIWRTTIADGILSCLLVCRETGLVNILVVCWRHSRWKIVLKWVIHYFCKF